MSDLEEGLDDFDVPPMSQDAEFQVAPVPHTSFDAQVRERREKTETSDRRLSCADERLWQTLVKGFMAKNRGAVLFFGFFVGLFLFLLLLSVLLIFAVPRHSNPRAEWTSYRLPDWQKPVFYSINVTVDFEAGTIGGRETIRVLFTNQTDFRFSPSNSRIDQRTTEHEIMLARYWYYDGRIL